MSERLRLRDVDPEALASAASQALVQHATAQLAAVTSGKLPEALAELARYARGEVTGAKVAELLNVIAPLFRSVVNGSVGPLDFLESRPSSPLTLVVAAACARRALDSGTELTCNELAVLTGIHRDHLTTMAAKIPGSYRLTKAQDPRRAWRFRPSADLRKWVRTNAM